MAKLGRVLRRRGGPWGTAMVVWEIWKRIPPKYRRRVLRQARKHGPTLVKYAYRARRRSRGKRS
jgi:hypothetical protein